VVARRGRITHPPRRPGRVVLLRQDAPAERANPGRGSYELSEPVETGRTDLLIAQALPNFDDLHIVVNNAGCLDAPFCA
jgi:hypothetical protein